MHAMFSMGYLYLLKVKTCDFFKLLLIKQVENAEEWKLKDGNRSKYEDQSTEVARKAVYW